MDKLQIPFEDKISEEASETYVFPFHRTKLSIAALTAAVFAISSYLCLLPIGTGIVVYSSEYRRLGIWILSMSGMILVLNILLITYVISIRNFRKRYQRYYNVLRFRRIQLMDDLSAYVGVNEKKVIRDLEYAIRKKLIPQGHFGTDHIFLLVSDEAYERYKEKQAVFDRYYQKQIEERARMNERTAQIQEILDQGEVYVKKIHESNDLIKDKLISQKLERMEKVVAMIFHETDINPDQADRLGMLLNYYLPSTEKLLESYIEIDERTVKTKSLDHTRREIEDALDLLNDSFEKMLDHFYREKEVDILSDISAMEKMMKQEGLTDR